MITRRGLFRLALLGLVLGVGPHYSSLAQRNKGLIKHFGLIFGTAYGPDDRPLNGVKVVIHPAGQKHPRWELISNHRGEFALRIPPGPGDYVVSGEAEVATTDPSSHHTKNKRLKGEAKTHVEGEERQDVGLHLN
ncbi:MAG TPA: hypothetical protein VNW97_01345 [Candidatus Saccharimonadales bacterium]|nr:hypothetical protein [Candidatus Saccharimonadales bacterium]